MAGIFARKESAMNSDTKSEQEQAKKIESSQQESKKAPCELSPALQLHQPATEGLASPHSKASDCFGRTI